jgi:predicted glycosyltransferase
MSNRHIWIDIDNSPHVPFFQPIIKELREERYSLTLTARNAFQVSELMKLHRMQCKAIGRHYGKNRLMKALGLVVRSAQLFPIVFRE